MALEDIGEGDNALNCVTNITACCNQPGNGNWFFPNGTRVPSSGEQWDFHTTKGQMVVRLNRRRVAVDGIYRCEITDPMNVDLTIYVGVYTASTGKWYMYTLVLFNSFATLLQCFQKSGSHIASLCIVNKFDYLTKYTLCLDMIATMSLQLQNYHSWRTSPTSSAGKLS